MMIDVDTRQMGKTTTLIMDSYFTGVPIIVTSVSRRNNLLNQARQMGMLDVKCYTVTELSDKRKEEGIEGVFIDDLEDVLQQMLGVKVIKATLERRLR